MVGILFRKNCEGALFELKPRDMRDVASMRLNNKAITYIKMVVLIEILVYLKGLTIVFKIWEKLKATYEITTPVNQVYVIVKKCS